MRSNRDLPLSSAGSSPATPFQADGGDGLRCPRSLFSGLLHVGEGAEVRETVFFLLTMDSVGLELPIGLIIGLIATGLAVVCEVYLASEVEDPPLPSSLVKTSASPPRESGGRV